MKRVLVLLIATLTTPLAHADDSGAIVSFDAGQAVVGALLDGSTFIFSYEKPLGPSSNNSLRFFGTTGTRCATYCWDFTYLGAEMRYYNGTVGNSSYYGMDVFLGNDEQYGFVGGVDVSFGYAKQMGNNWILDPYFRAGEVGFAIGLNVGKRL